MLDRNTQFFYTRYTFADPSSTIYTPSLSVIYTRSTVISTPSSTISAHFLQIMATSFYSPPPNLHITANHGSFRVNSTRPQISRLGVKKLKITVEYDFSSLS